MGPFHLSYKYIPYVGTGIFALIMFSLFVYILTIKLKEKREEREFEKQVRFSIDPEVEYNEEPSFLTRALNALPNLLVKAKIFNENVSVEIIRRKILLYGSAVFVIATLFTRNPLGGLLPVFFLYAGTYVFANYKISKTRNLMNEQIPAFVSVFKANIQANQHSQNAMINAINNTASPLYDELARPKSIMEAGDFRPGIVALRMNTENETLRQMASCIELASSSGSNIEEQIEIIESIIKTKQSLERKKKLGVNENKPLFFVASLMVPIAFFGSYFISDMHREYWFTTAFSYAVIVGVIAVMALASWFTWLIIKKIDVG